MRLITVTFVGLFVCAAFAASQSGRARAQMPPLTPPPVASPVAPDSAVEGTIASMDRDGAVLQTPDGQSVHLALVPRGYLLVDPSPQALQTGMRVFVTGFSRADGTIAVDEIDVLVPLNLLLVTPAPAQTTVPSPAPT